MALLSICIPSYKQPKLLLRCLKSIEMQSYKNVEVIISDDTPDESIKNVAEQFTGKLFIKYFKNDPALRSPSNWNNALDKAVGKYSMLLHHDDWLADKNTLKEFIEVLQHDEHIDFVFSRNTAIYESGNSTILQTFPSIIRTMKKKPNHLLRSNVIGPPSNVVLKTSINVRYDTNFIWLVDVDYYVRLLKHTCAYKYIDKHLVSIGLHPEQTTAFCNENFEIIIKENFLFAAKIGESALKDILIYDYYWRFIRNNKIRNITDIISCDVVPEKILPAIIKMISFQSKFPLAYLKYGLFSKVLMFTSYSMYFLSQRKSAA
jgi:glycosyltransferase involved in cell wall biosynthesis